MHVHGHHMPMSSPSVQLPRNLARPPFAEVSRDAIIATAPELASVPVEYIRRGLRPKANQHLEPSEVADADLHTPFTITLVYFRASVGSSTTADISNTCSRRIGFKIPILQRASDDISGTFSGSGFALCIVTSTAASLSTGRIEHYFASAPPNAAFASSLLHSAPVHVSPSA
ncbi:hypothetical protein MD484_g690, partial [Candolleomyces efflorescens]